MLDAKGEYRCAESDDEHWTIDAVADRNRAPLAYYANHVAARDAAQRLLGAEKPVRSIYLLSDASGDAADVIPDFIRRLPELRCLRLPSQIAPTLRPETIGPQVKALSFYGTYDKRYWNNKTVSLPPTDAVFEGIEALSGETLSYRVETRFRFAPEVFPHLRSLGFTFDAKRQFASTLRALPHLIAVSAAGFDSIESLADLLPAENLVSLTLSGNKTIETLRGFGRFPNLRYLKVGSLTHLRTLEGIESVERLEFVGVYWSKRVEDTDALRDLPALRTIETFGVNAKHPTWLSLKQAAEARGIAVRLIG